MAGARTGYVTMRRCIVFVHVRRSVAAFHDVASAGFGHGVIDAYERGRPTYSDADTELLLRCSGAIDGLALPSSGLFPSAPILELACGTGKFTRPLVRVLQRLGGPHATVNVTLVDPAEMGSNAGKEFPQLPFARTTADALGHLSDGSVHAAVAAQAFHWFADASSLREISRVIRPRGQLLLVWNKREREASPLMAALESLLDESYALADASTGKTPRHNTGEWQNVFESPEARESWRPLKTKSVCHPYVGTAEQFVDWMMSISVVSQRDAASKAEIACRTRRLLEEHPDARVPHPEATASGVTSGAQYYTIPLFTELVWTSKLH